MKNENKPITVDHLRFHIVWNAVFLAISIGVWAAYFYFGLQKNSTASMIASVALILVSVVIFVFALIGLRDPNRIIGPSKKNGKQVRYENFGPREKRSFVSSVYYLWAVIVLSGALCIIILFH